MPAKQTWRVVRNSRKRRNHLAIRLDDNGHLPCVVAGDRVVPRDVIELVGVRRAVQLGRNRCALSSKRANGSSTTV